MTTDTRDPISERRSKFVDALSAFSRQHRAQHWEGTFGDFALENVGDGKMGKRLRWAQIINQQLTAFVGGYEAVSKLYTFHPIAAYFHR